jgi:hypothetical protein
MKLGRFTNKLFVTAAGAVVLFGSATFAAAQRDEYNEYQEALRNEQRQCARYQRNPSRSNYNECMDARQDTREEYTKYQRALRQDGYRNSGYYNNNNGYYNDGRVIVANTNPYRSGMYRIYTNGQYYNVDNRGYSVLREAVNRGYQQGYRAGIRDRRYGMYNYHRDSLYMSGTYGYSSVVARNQYQYYFQQGFQKGYEDGFYSRRTYGTGTSILGSVLNTILNVATDRNDPWDR